MFVRMSKYREITLRLIDFGNWLSTPNIRSIIDLPYMVTISKHDRVCYQFADRNNIAVYRIRASEPTTNTFSLQSYSKRDWRRKRRPVKSCTMTCTGSRRGASNWRRRCPRPVLRTHYACSMVSAYPNSS